MGSKEDPDRIFDKVMLDEIFYRQSQGGVTVSGGEPLSQPDFVRDFLRRCKAAGLHTAIDTSGYADWNSVKQVLEYTDLVLYDLKHMDNAIHKKLTNVPNDIILENARRIHHELGVPMQVRTSIVPGYNDSVDNISATARFIAEELSPSVEYHLLPYHKLGEIKQERLEWPSERLFTSGVPGNEHIDVLKNAAESFGLNVFIGG